MFRAILYAQWKWTRLVVALGTVAGFALPILSLQSAGRSGSASAGDLLRTVQSWGVLYPALAATLAVLTAISAWTADHRGRHVYALSLPVPRWRYALLRLAAGGVLLIPPALAVLVGGMLATATATLPAGIHGYAGWLGLRFALTLAVAYSVFFAISSGTARTAGAILGAFATLIVLSLLAGAADINLHIFEIAQSTVLTWPGPLAIFAGRWMLIDV